MLQRIHNNFTKSDVINYFSGAANVLLPHLAGRPMTLFRLPDGAGGQQFFEKNVPNGAPTGLPTVRLPNRKPISPQRRRDRVRPARRTRHPGGRRTWPPSKSRSHSGASTQVRRLPPDLLVFDLQDP
ncbi:hypothetical protein [Amycolatopsis australiensis]|uniref:non-homologous end-joining DNA ligase LigD n=1 Tax=Amycolatopsis australiensis TaxID=546364 RepID=UPI0031844579